MFLVTHLPLLITAQLLNVNHLLVTGGLLFIAAIIFAESGMMIGFLFPGDTLLFSAGILASSHQLHIVTVLLTVAAAAILGDNVGYQIGRSLGPRLFTKEDGMIFRKEHITRSHEFFAKYGSRTMLLAHFVPIVRSFAPVVAGAGAMPRKLFVLFDAIGCIAWTLLITLLGYYLGKRFPQVEKLVEPILIGIILVFLIPTLWHVLRDPKFRSFITRRNRHDKAGTE